MASFLSGLGYAAGAAAKAGLSTYEQLDAMDKAEREKKAYEEEQAYKAELKGAVAPATAEQRQGFQVTGLGNKPFYIPADSAPGAREAYTNAGYTVGDTVTPYQEMTTSRVAPGTTGVGKYYEQQSTATRTGKTDADTAMTGYNAAGAGLGRQRDVAMKYGKFSEAGALDTLSEAPERKKALGLSIKAAERAENYAADEQKAIQRGTDFRAKLFSDNPDEVMAGLDEGTQIHSTSMWGGNSKSRSYKDSDGRIMVEFDPGNGLPKKTVPFSSALAEQISASYTEHHVNASSPQGMRLASQELRRATQAGDTVAARVAGDALQAEGQKAHTAAVVAASAQRSAEHIQSMKQQIALHGSDSPQGKILAETLKSTQDYNERVKFLMDNKDTLAPEEIMKRISDIKMLHPDKGVTKLGTYENGVKTGETVTSVFDQFGRAAVTAVANNLTMEAAKNYPGAGIQVITGPSGGMRYTTPKLKAQDKSYSTLDELVKAERIKPGGKNTSLTRTAEPATTPGTLPGETTQQQFNRENEARAEADRERLRIAEENRIARQRAATPAPRPIGLGLQ